MIQVKGYKLIDNYNDFQKLLVSAYDKSGKSYVNIASEIGVSTHVTAINALNFGEQKVSDSVLSKTMKSIGLDGFIMHHEGEKVYYVKN